jgi:diguanylate cyclase (GGDEF)-like protein/PAS domain S-box-containing protein
VIDRPLRVLCIEDSADDFQLIRRALQRGGRQIEAARAETLADLRLGLARGEYDLVLTDHELQGFDSTDVLMTVSEMAPEMPCMLVSGKVGEEAVSQAMRFGAADYVAKDNLEPLPSAVERTLAVNDRRRSRMAGEEALARSGRFFEAVFVNARDAMLILNDVGRLVGANPAAASMLGIDRDSLLGLRMDDLLPAAVRDAGPHRWDELRDVEERRGEVELLRGDGVLVATEYVATAEFLPGRHMLVLRDIRERRASEAQAKRRIAQQEAIAELGEHALRGGSLLDDLMRETVVRVADTLGAQTASILQLRSEEDVFVIEASVGLELSGTGDRLRFGSSSSPLASFTVLEGTTVVVDDFEHETRFGRSPLLSDRGIRSAVCVEIPGDDRPFGVLASTSARPGAFDADDATFLTSIAHLLADALERARNEEEMRRQALHDPLTGLANRILLYDRLTQGLTRAGRLGTRLAVMCLDVDHFKTLNDTFGHRAGDELLTEVGSRIQGLIRASDTVARFGGDEFVIVYDGVRDEADAEALAARVLESLRRPFDFDDGQHRMSASIGIALSDATNLDAQLLLRDADIALYRSKERGRSTWTVATEAMRVDVIERSRTNRDLERAIDEDELFLAYQPIVSLGDGALSGVEALIRWQDPVRGLIMPGHFIPVAEETGLIFRVGEWVLREACAQAAAWRKEFGERAPLPMHVNVSAQQVANADLPLTVRDILEETGLAPSDLAVEITESALPEDLDAPMEVLADLRMMGVAVVLDDFGTGYSSLSYLDRYPIDTLKIDRSFVSPLGDPGVPAPIVTAIAGMARAMAIGTVAEGVETIEQVAAVATLGCDRAQGYYFARPGTPDKVAELVRDDSPLRELATAASALSCSLSAFGSIRHSVGPGASGSPTRTRSIDGHRQTILAALLAADALGAESVIYTALADRIPPDVIDSRIIGPAMIEVGNLWERGEVSVADERLATGIAARAASLAAEADESLSRGASPQLAHQRVLLANVAEENHVLGLQMVADMLLMLGMDVRYYGGLMPTEALREAAAEWQPDVIGLSLTRTDLASRLEDQLAGLREACPEAILLLGGQGVTEELAERAGASFMKDVEELVNTWPPRSHARHADEPVSSP